MKKVTNYGLVILLFVCVICCVSCQKKCEPGATQPCYCPDGTAKEQVCNEDGTAWADCECTMYSYWNDPATNLTWQDPQKDGYDNADGGVEPADAIRYCEEVAFGGYNDWRLPTIEELRTLVRGNPGTETGGECPLVNDGVSSDMNNPACAPNTLFGGPGTGTAEGCYWPPELAGTCNKPDPAVNLYLEYVSSTRCPDEPTKGWYGVIMFESGAVCWNHINTIADVRCVRTGPTTPVTCEEGAKEACAPGETRQCAASNDNKTGAQVCAADGSCWGPCESTVFTKSPPPTDVCDQCDQLKLTIRVPEKITVKPVELMAYLYVADSWTFPPNRPPDGGNSDAQVMNPVIDVDTPLNMTVATCTYYRKSCNSGQYKLYVALMQTETIPPTLQEGDYWWGMDQEPITLGDGPAREIPMDITLVAWKP